jgi:Family of unknown function (DUF6308)
MSDALGQKNPAEIFTTAAPAPASVVPGRSGDVMSQNPPVPGGVLLENAVQVSLRALSEDDRYPASGRLAAYYCPDGNYAGVSFAEMGPADADDIGASDLHALTMLSVTVGPRSTRRLLPGGEQLGPYRDHVRACLSRIAMADKLEDAGPELLKRMSELFLAVLDALKDPTAKGESNPWVTASKLCSRKRPGTFPVRDNVVCKWLGLIGKGLPQGDHRVDYAVFQYLLTNREVIRAVDDLGDRVRASGRRPDQHRLKILDAALWTHATWALGAGRREKRCEREA